MPTSKRAMISRRLALSLLASAAAAPAASGAGVNMFCRFQCDGKDLDSCIPGTCGAPKPSCKLVAEQPFADAAVCNMYKASEPSCNAATRACAEAANFQLVYDRNADFARIFSLGDFHGVQLLFNDTAAVFVPGSRSFLFKKDVPAAAKWLHDKLNQSLVLAIEQVITVPDKVSMSGQVIHARGCWRVNASGSAAVPYYARWAEKSESHWVLESLVVAVPKELPAAGSPADDLAEEIKARADEWNKLYNAQNYSALAKMYSEGAAIVPREGKLRADIQAFLSTAPLGPKSNIYPTIVTQAPGNEAVHEIGFSGSTGHGYFAHWVKRDVDRVRTWVIDSQVLAVFPKHELAVQV